MQQKLDGRYEILKPLGGGGFGKTYLARDLRIPGTPYCVVKRLHCVSRNPQDIQLAQQLFQREAESLAKLGHHDQIPRLLAYFTEDEEFFLVEDYIEGRSLEEDIKPGQPWPESQVIHLIRSVLDVLAYVHSQGVIHRDIKPDNLIRRQSDGKIVLIDFGAIKQLEQAHPGQSHRTGTQIGTAGYMPPEQAQGKPRPNSDLYGIGMVAISAITGQPAMGLPDDPQTGEIVWQHLAPVSPGLIQILSRMVRYHFQHRYQSVIEVQQDLQRLSAGSTTGSAPSGATPGVFSVPPHPITASSPTQVVSPAVSQPNPPPKVRGSQAPKKSTGSSWLLGLFLAILIPALGGAASLLFSQGIIKRPSESSSPKTARQNTCTAIVNGNIRSERTAYYGNQNIVQTGQGQSFEIGSRKTRGGWIEIKLPSGGTAWAHLDVVSNESSLQTCLNQNNIALSTIGDIPPPARPKPKPPSVAPTPPRQNDADKTTTEEPPSETTEEDNDSALPSDQTDNPESNTDENTSEVKESQLPVEESQGPPLETTEEIERSAPETPTPKPKSEGSPPSNSSGQNRSRTEAAE